MERRVLPLVGETLYETRLPGGMPGFYLWKPAWVKTFATVSVRYGSLDSAWFNGGRRQEVPPGIAHFLEHKLFEQEDGSVMDAFAALGAQANAYTNYTSTTYLFAAARRVEEALRLLLSFLWRPHFTAASVEKEQGIILQELLMYRDDPSWQVWRNLLEGLYQHHPVRIDIGGTPESIRTITPDLLYLCHETFYRPDNMVFFAVGPLAPEDVFATVAEVVPEAPKRPGVERYRPEEPTEVGRARVIATMPVGVPLLEVGFKVPSGRMTLREELGAALLLDVLYGRSSPFYARLYQAGAIGERFSYHVLRGGDFAALIIGGETREPERVAEEVLREAERARRTGLDADAFEAAKRAEIGAFVSLFDAPEATAHAFYDLYYQGDDLASYLPTLLSITVEEAHERLELIRPEQATLSVVLPADQPATVSRS